MCVNLGDTGKILITLSGLTKLANTRFLANSTCSYANITVCECVSVCVLPLLLGQPVVHGQQLCVVSLGRQLVHNSILCLWMLSGTLQGIQHACPIREGEKD